MRAKDDRSFIGVTLLGSDLSCGLLFYTCPSPAAAKIAIFPWVCCLADLSCICLASHQLQGLMAEESSRRDMPRSKPCMLG